MHVSACHNISKGLKTKHLSISKIDFRWLTDFRYSTATKEMQIKIY